MKKISLTFIVIFLVNSCICLSAQPAPLKKVEFGFSGGVNVTNMNFNKGVPAPATPVDPSWKSGVMFGVLLNIPVINNFSVQPEYSYVQMGGEWKGSGKRYKMNYLCLPVVFKYALSKKWYLVAGPEFGLLLNSKEISENSTQNITHDTEERNFGAIGGIEFKVAKHVNLDFRYVHGLNHVGIWQRSNITEFKYESLRLTGCIVL